MKETSFDKTLLEAGALMKRGYAAVITNASRAIAVITVIIASLVIFTDVAFTDIYTEKFTSTLIFMLIASYLMYFSTSDAGEKLGEESAEYEEALKEYRAVRESVSASEITALREFLCRYSEEERRYRIGSFLLSEGYSSSEFFLWQSTPSPISDRAKLRAFRRAARMKTVTVTPGVILCATGSRHESELVCPEEGRFFRMLLRMIPTTLCTFFSASVMLTAKDGLTVNTVIDGIVKLATLPIIGFKGYASGYCFVRSSRIPWIQTKTEILRAFVDSRGAAHGVALGEGASPTDLPTEAA